MKINHKLSKELSERIQARPRNCYKNSVLALVSLHAQGRVGYRDSGATYVEGYYVSPELKIPMEHGFLIIDGEIVDPTVVLGIYEEDHIYFPALRWTLAQVLDESDKEDATTTFPLYWHGSGFPESQKEMHLAMIEAYRWIDPELAEQMERMIANNAIRD